MPTNDEANGGKNDITILGFEYPRDGYTTVKFRRLLNTDDKNDAILKQGQLKAMWAVGNEKTLSYHEMNKGLLVFNFV